MPEAGRGSPAARWWWCLRSSPLLEDERQVHRVVLVVEAEGVHADVDPHPHRQLALGLTARRDLVGVRPALVPLPGAGQVVLGVHDRGTVTEVHHVQLWMEEDSPRGRIEQEEGL